jgi:hypothetical protein
MKMIRKTWIVLGLLLLVAPPAMAQGPERDNYVPNTISPEAQQTLKAIYDAKAYADRQDLTDARVSPLYGDFSKGFSPSLITEGTKCIFFLPV